MAIEDFGCVTKQDFVCRYIPNASKKSVWGWFNRNVHCKPQLMARLHEVGYRKSLRSLTAKMVDLIENQYRHQESNGNRKIG